MIQLRRDIYADESFHDKQDLLLQLLLIDRAVHIVKFSMIAPDWVSLQEVLTELDLQNLPFLKPSWSIRFLR